MQVDTAFIRKDWNT